MGQANRSARSLIPCNIFRSIRSEPGSIGGMPMRAAIVGSRKRLRLISRVVRSVSIVDLFNRFGRCRAWRIVHICVGRFGARARVKPSLRRRCLSVRRAGSTPAETSVLARLVEIFVSGGQRMCLCFHREFVNWAAQYWTGQTDRRRLGLRGRALLALQLVLE